ncbi:hypothetical protein LEP1GSC059_0319 [Leptospira noguchii serovar Panama str. CZ214]|uniref:Uncharacterized protein n=1 Tax=Leptospira noguchii serovar Panama str. CZ214 TaxID=1001595 RepID=T0FUS5_9LEPT|nr:hypothetical protein [Leptospira noguchii]EQA73270.1 hypothetical protein LEP1GSC059_0319 [Leptospira noguchii serovar Panama str. CZ214]
MQDSKRILYRQEGTKVKCDALESSSSFRLVAKLFRFKLKFFSFFNPTLKLSRFIEKSNRFRLREILILFFVWELPLCIFCFLTGKYGNYCKITFSVNS